MERAAKLLGQSKSASRYLTQQDLAQAAWRTAVGKRLAAHTRPGALYGRKLIVEVEDDVWSSQLTTLRPQILRKLDYVQPGLLTSLEFRVVPRRRMPASETAPGRASHQPALPFAERIEDPVLSRLYQASQRRALA